MITKELSIVQRVQRYFIESMYVEVDHELPDGGLWTYEAKVDGYRCPAASYSNRRRALVLTAFFFSARWSL
jgi:ATP-dependent DNA ligase